MTPGDRDDNTPIAVDHFQTLGEIEEQTIKARLAYYGGDKTLAARSLGVALKTIYNRLRYYRLRDAKR